MSERKSLPGRGRGHRRPPPNHPVPRTFFVQWCSVRGILGSASTDEAELTVSRCPYCTVDHRPKLLGVVVGEVVHDMLDLSRGG
jgi:hypothetical protein